MSGSRPIGRLLWGVWNVGRFRAEGLAGFTATPRAFVHSLMAQTVLPLLGGLLMLRTSSAQLVSLYVLANIVALLAPPVLSHAMADTWRRDKLWLRYAVAYNWCQAVLSLVLTSLGIGGGLAMAGGGHGGGLIQLAIMVVACYGIALNWFLVRAGLELSRGQTTLFVIAVWFATLVLVVAPFVVSSLLQGAS